MLIIPVTATALPDRPIVDQNQIDATKIEIKWKNPSRPEDYVIRGENITIQLSCVNKPDPKCMTTINDSTELSFINKDDVQIQSLVYDKNDNSLTGILQISSYAEPNNISFIVRTTSTDNSGKKVPKEIVLNSKLEIYLSDNVKRINPPYIVRGDKQVQLEIELTGKLSIDPKTTKAKLFPSQNINTGDILFSQDKLTIPLNISDSAELGYRALTIYSTDDRSPDHAVPNAIRVKERPLPHYLIKQGNQIVDLNSLLPNKLVIIEYRVYIITS